MQNRQRIFDVIVQINRAFLRLIQIRIRFQGAHDFGDGFDAEQIIPRRDENAAAIVQHVHNRLRSIAIEQREQALQVAFKVTASNIFRNRPRIADALRVQLFD